MPSLLSSLLPALAAFATGGLLSIMVLLNGTLATYGGALFASWAAHGSGALAATAMLAMLALWRRRAGARRAAQDVRASEGSQTDPQTDFAPNLAPLRAPLWAYLGGLSGAITVMFTSATLNSALALSGTLALGLVGQVGFGLAADRFGLFGLPRRRPALRDMLALTLILAGSALIIFSDPAGQAAADLFGLGGAGAGR